MLGPLHSIVGILLTSSLKSISSRILPVVITFISVLHSCNRTATYVDIRKLENELAQVVYIRARQDDLLYMSL